MVGIRSRGTSPSEEARWPASPAPAQAPTHDRTRAPRSRAERRRSYEESRTALPLPERFRRPTSRAGAPSVRRSPRSGSEPGTGARNRIPGAGPVVRPLTASAKPACTRASPSTCMSANGWMRRDSPPPRHANSSSFSVSGPSVLSSISPPGRKMRRALRQRMTDRVEPWHRHIRQNEVHGV